jgi:ribosomal protein S12 methylthiotransferase accessory factor
MPRVLLSPAALVLPTPWGVVLHSHAGSFGVEDPNLGPVAERIVPLLDGTRSMREVEEAFPKELRPLASLFVSVLERRGLLESIAELEDGLPPRRWAPQDRFFRTWAADPDAAIRQLRQARILIVGLEPWGAVAAAEIAAAEIAAAGVGAIHVIDDGQVEPEDLLWVRTWDPRMVGRPRAEALAATLAETASWCRVTTASLHSENGDFVSLPRTSWDLVIASISPNDLVLHMKTARFAQEAGLTSIFASLVGLEAFVGPVVVPGKTACWNCFRLRLLANAEQPKAAHAVQEWARQRRFRSYQRAGLAPAAPLVGHLLALEALKLISGYAPSQLIGCVLIQDLLTLEGHRHAVMPMPRCAVCGGAKALGHDEEKPARLETAATPQDLNRALSDWVDARTGVIAQLCLRSREEAEPELPLCATAVMPLYTEGADLPRESDAVGGKGLTAAGALLCAAGEAFERYSAARVQLEDLVRCRLDRLEGDVLDPRRLVLYEQRQYEQPGFPFAPFDPQDHHWWTRGRWMDTGQAVWLPALLTYYVYPRTAQKPYCQVTSNGLAAGANLEDAALRGICELIERDAFMLTWLCMRRPVRLLADDALAADLHNMLDQLRSCGARIEFYLLDAGLSIPTVLCLGLGDGKRWPGVTAGTAAHMSPRVAAAKAALELGYSGPMQRRMMLQDQDSIPRRPDQVKTFRDHALFYIPAERAAACDFLRSPAEAAIALSSLPEPKETSLDRCAQVLASNGIRIAIADVTAPDVARSPFRVVRALGTYVQPLHCGFGLERLANLRLRALLKTDINTDLHPLY